MKMKSLLLATIAVVLSSSAFAQGQESGLYSKEEKEMFAPSGKARRAYSLYGAHGNCTPWNLKDIDVRTTKEPSNGKLEITQGEVVAGFKKDGPTAHCGGKKVRAILVEYKSTDKFVGQDEFELFVMWPNGRASEFYTTVNVK
jgi:hypothetical protein